MTTYLPLDTDGNPIPALRLKDNKAHRISVTESTARNSAPLSKDTAIISLYATEDMFLRFGDETVAATEDDHFFPAGIYYDMALGSEKNGHATHIAAIRASADGTLYISEKE